jgi:activator of HSP90 ATPase
MGKTVTIKDKVILPGDPIDVYNALIDADKHAEFTGSPASSDPRIGGRFEAWDGYISGSFIELIPGKKITQEWISSDFPENSTPSRLEIVLRKIGEGVELTMIHSGVPEEIADDIRKGWTDYYWVPLRDYLSRQIR